MNQIEVTSARRWGNGAGVLLPRAWIGKEVKAVLVDRTLEIQKEVLRIVEPYLKDIFGIYLVGSYARNEQQKDSDVDIIVISKNTKKEIASGKYHVSIITLDGVKRALEKNPILILPRLIEAKAILNYSLLEELKKIKIKKDSFKEFIKECERIIKINRELIELDKMDFDYLNSVNVLYSLILRLRGIFLIRCIIDKKGYSRNDFFKWLKEELVNLDVENIYNVYRDIRNDKKIKTRINIEIAEKLVKMLEKETDKLKK